MKVDKLIYSEDEYDENKTLRRSIRKYEPERGYREMLINMSVIVGMFCFLWLTHTICRSIEASNGVNSKTVYQRVKGL